MESLNNISIPKIRYQVSNDIVNLFSDLEGRQNQIVVLKHLPRIGKTHNVLEYLDNSNYLSLYVSDIHGQIEQFTNKFESMWVIKGRQSMCPLLDDESAPSNVVRYADGNKFNNFSCQLCYKFYNCAYYNQFDFNKINIIVSIAKESLPNKKIHSAFDFIIIDEDMTKANMIKPFIPTINKDILRSLTYGDDIITVYNAIKDISKKEAIVDDFNFKELKENVIFIRSRKVIKSTIDELNEYNINDDERKKIIEFLAKINSTLDWAYKCKILKVWRPYFLVPYLHYAFDLVNKYNSNLLLLNATFDERIYNLMKDRYGKGISDIKTIIDSPISNKNSYLFQYNNFYRSCSLEGLKKYGKDIFPTINSILRFCNKRGLKSGLITFSSYEDYFTDYDFGFDVIKNFKAHRGTNDFDKVDILVILGTFNIPRIDYLKNNYAITGEFLSKDALKNWNPITENGLKISVPVNDKFKETRLYHLYEEHTQAILRSGAHINNNKAVIAFGHVPRRIESIFNYKTFDSSKSLISGYLTKIFPLKNN